MTDDDAILAAIGILQDEERIAAAMLEQLRMAAEITWGLGEVDLGVATDLLVDALERYDRERSRTIMRRLARAAG